MTDLVAFGAADFDAKAWVNTVCSTKPANEPLERYLAELEMKLHLSGEDLEASLEDESVLALQRIPAAVQEISHVKGDVASLKADVQKMLRQLETTATAAEHSVALLVQIERVKTRMEEACSTLKEATELAQLFQKVDSIFSSGNLQRMAALLGTMRRSLSLVGSVPEFQGGLQRLESLEDRFQALVEPQLSVALSDRKGDKVQQLAGFLAGIGRPASIEKLYTAARVSALQALWDSHTAEASQRGFVTWLPSFYDELAAAAESEFRWTATSLPDQHPGIVLLLFKSLFGRIDKSFRSHLATALAQGGQRGALSVLISLQATAGNFAEGLAQRLAGLLAEDLLPLLDAVYAPFEAQVARYGELEGEQLRAEIATVELPDAASSAVETVVMGLKAAVPAAVAIIQAAYSRCAQCSGGTELQALLLVADEALVQLGQRLLACLRDLRASCLPDSASSSAPSSEETSALLPLLTVAVSLQSRVGILDAHLRGKALELQPLLERADLPVDPPLDAVSLRLRASQGRQLVQLRAFLRQVQDARFSALPNAAAQAIAFQEAVHQLIYDLLMLKVKAELAGVASLPSWQASEPESKFNLPAFSAYPQAYATAAGEYLMMLPQLLETLLAASEEEGAEEAQVDADWLDKVAAGAADMYVAQVQQIQVLSTQGSSQLAADLEYFCNVLSALGVALPPALATWQVASAWPAEEFPGAAKAALEDGVVDKAALQAVAAARQLPLA